MNARRSLQARVDKGIPVTSGFHPLQAGNRLARQSVMQHVRIRTPTAVSDAPSVAVGSRDVPVADSVPVLAQELVHPHRHRFILVPEQVPLRDMFPKGAAHQLAAQDVARTTGCTLRVVELRIHIPGFVEGIRWVSTDEGRPVVQHSHVQATLVAPPLTHDQWKEPAPRNECIVIRLHEKIRLVESEEVTSECHQEFARQSTTSVALLARQGQQVSKPSSLERKPSVDARCILSLPCFCAHRELVGQTAD
mmetsp:Transcript_176898/g.561629  ORF Transcript_176898/g.561629 Transcript_176898/m.561629 type:complete len:250 (+) Transcript_176898:14-763(+)